MDRVKARVWLLTETSEVYKTSEVFVFGQAAGGGLPREAGEGGSERLRQRSGGCGPPLRVTPRSRGRIEVRWQ
ncbi:MAG: hypothetical protein BWY10_01604 [Chloroflexi bacterium ADurb.Bin180]|nr:MAG: hypothetical protein BWY10_01604 [Chloroflexi bacterium ADurb.Bin180]